MGTEWTLADMPPQNGRVAIVTGANSGLGLVGAEALAAKGATVVMACRSQDKAEQAANAIRSRHASAQLIVAKLDTAELASVKTFAAFVLDKCQRLDLLINNAGVMAIPHAMTRDGFNLQFATNHLGHFALTGLLIERLNASPAARVVSVSSVAAAPGIIDFDDLMGEQNNDPWKAYYQSKLANLLFARELHRRLTGAGAPTWSIAAHPGVATTNLFNTPGGKKMKFLISKVYTLFRMNHSAANGALSILFAATSPDVQRGGYCGPKGLFGFRGPPGPTPFPKGALDDEAAQRLWEVSERLTGVRYSIS